jgi:hypothetical protein
MRSWLTGALSLFLLAPLSQADEASWPQEIVAEGGAVVLLYQPQIEDFSGNDLVGRAAVSAKSPASGNVPVFGAIWFEAKIDTDRDARTAIIRDLTGATNRESDWTIKFHDFRRPIARRPRCGNSGDRRSRTQAQPTQNYSVDRTGHTGVYRW